MPRIIVSGDDAEVVANYPYDAFDPETLPEPIVESVMFGKSSRNPIGDWGDYEDEPSYMFGMLVCLARRYAHITGQRDIDVLQALDENLNVEQSIKVGNHYPVELLDTEETMAEFTLIEGRLVILSNANGEQQFSGEYAVVEQRFRAGTSKLVADDLSWVEACDWCKDHIENLNSIGA